jgi:hypothetical protein
MSRIITRFQDISKMILLTFFPSEILILIIKLHLQTAISHKNLVKLKIRIQNILA